MGGREIEVYFESIHLFYFNFDLNSYNKNDSGFYYKWPKTYIFQKLCIE